MAAGLGFKTFTTGEVLTAADTNGYLMQGINVFASSAARAAAITSPQEGQYSFLKDTNALEYYDGAAWVGAPVGDITAVTAGTGISGGGSSGDVTITNSMATAIDAKGDLVAGTGADAFSRLAVGANNTVLTADSAQATGLKWAAPASPTAVACSVYNAGGSVTYVANVPQILNFTNENFDTNTMHDNSTNTSRITIPTGYAGKYLVNGTMRSASGVGYVLIRVYQNGTAVTNGLESGELVRGYYAANAPGINGSVVLNCSASDYIEIGVQTDTAGALTTYSRFSVSYLGA